MSRNVLDMAVGANGQPSEGGELMGSTLKGIAQQLKGADKKVQLIYAFNGSGKTRLSLEFKKLIAPKLEEGKGTGNHREKILYYNAFTEDLFYWDNDLKNDADRRLKIQPNNYTKWVLEDQGQDMNVITYFQRYTDNKLTPKFNGDFSEVTFSYQRGNEEKIDNIKISKGEESNFIWSIFYSFIGQVINDLNAPDPTDRETAEFDELEYIFIDDPVSSLDENHLIKLAVDLAQLIQPSKPSESSESKVKFIITTHNPLFYNVLHNELNKKNCYLLKRLEDGTFSLEKKKGDSNRSFFYHLHIKKVLEKAITDNEIERYHFMLLRNLYEKTASFLGYIKWSDLLPGDKKLYLNRIIQFASHSTLSTEVVAEPSPEEKKIIKFLLEHLTKEYCYWQEKKHDN